MVGSGIKSNAEECGCEAKAICSIKGDPHFKDFAGHESVIQSPAGDLVLYHVGEFKVTVTIGARGWVSKATFQNSAFSTDECSNKKTMSWTKDLGGQGAIDMTSTCVQVDKVWHLDTVITKKDKASDKDKSSDPAQTFDNIEAKLKSAGKCVTGQTFSNFTDTLLVGRPTGRPTMTCSCSRKCKMVGDPHLTSFYNDNKTNFDAGDIMLFAGQKTSLHVPVRDKWARSVEFDGQTYDAATECKNAKPKFRVTKTKQLPGNSQLELQLECETVQASRGYFWNIELEKINAVGGSNTAQTWEAAETSFRNKGECYFQKSLVVV